MKTPIFQKEFPDFCYFENGEVITLNGKKFIFPVDSIVLIPDMVLSHLRRQIAKEYYLYNQQLLSKEIDKLVNE